MLQKSFLDLNIKPRRGRLTLRGFYHPNAREGRKNKRLGENKKWKEEKEIRGNQLH